MNGEAVVQVRDHVLWVSHIQGAPETASWMRSIRSGSDIALVVDGVAGAWRKLKDGADGRPTDAFMPVSPEARTAWHALQETRGVWVSLQIVV